MTVKTKIQSLITAANTTTGESDATLTDAVQTLCDGYGQGDSFDWFSIAKGSAEGLFRNTDFTGHENLVLNLPLAGNALTDNSFKSFIYGATNLKTVVLNFGNPTGTLNLSYFASDPRTNTLTSIRINGKIKASSSMYCFLYLQKVIKEVIFEEIDFTKVTDTSNMFYPCNALETIAGIKPNTLKRSIHVGNCSLLSDDSIICLANAMNENASYRTLTLHRTPYERCSSILGTVTDGMFEADDAGTVTLADFITVTKGWSLAI